MKIYQACCRLPPGGWQRFADAMFAVMAKLAKSPCAFSAEVATGAHRAIVCKTLEVAKTTQMRHGTLVEIDD